MTILDWLAIEDESEQANRLVGKKSAASTPMKKRGPDLTGNLLG
jgi:hypothetical protein